MSGNVLRCRAPRPTGVRLIGCPHGGGSAHVFHPWHPVLPAHVEFHGVQYPGHGDRFGEAHLTDARSIGAEVATAVAALSRDDERPVLLYGHSMGALVAFHAALRLAAMERPPAAVTVSGLPAPGEQRPGRIHTGTAAQVRDELRRLGGVSDEILADPVLTDMIVDSTRADYQVVETYEPRGEVLDVPLTVHRGRDDTELDATEAAAWQVATTRPIVTRVFAGAHFHPYLDPAPVVADVTGAWSPRQQLVSRVAASEATMSGSVHRIEDVS